MIESIQKDLHFVSVSVPYLRQQSSISFLYARLINSRFFGHLIKGILCAPRKLIVLQYCTFLPFQSGTVSMNGNIYSFASPNDPLPNVTSPPVMQVDGVSYNMIDEGKDMKYFNCGNQRENIWHTNQ